MKRDESANRAASMLKMYEEVRSPSAVAAAFGVSEQTVCYWLPYRGLSSKWLTHVRRLEERVRRQKLQLATHSKQMRIATSAIKSLQPSPKKRALISTAIVAKFSVPRTVSNRIVGLGRNSGAVCHHAIQFDHVLIELMRAHLAQHPGRGFAGMYNAFLRHQPGTRQRALTLYTEHLMKKNRAKPSKVTPIARRSMARQGRTNQMWSMDFMQDALKNGTRYWLLNITDDFNREAISTFALHRRSAKAVVGHLETFLAKGRKPGGIRTDNGGEFKSVYYQSWAARRGIKTVYTRPGKPTDNAFVERFNRTVRSEVLRKYTFQCLDQVQGKLDDWRLNYNFVRPHQALGGLSPMQFSCGHDWYVPDKSG